MEEAELAMNIFRQAAELLKAKDNGAELTDEEIDLVWAAITPVINMPGPDMTVAEGLEMLAKLVEANNAVAGRVLVPRLVS